MKEGHVTKENPQCLRRPGDLSEFRFHLMIVDRIILYVEHFYEYMYYICIIHMCTYDERTHDSSAISDPAEIRQNSSRPPEQR